MAILGVYPFDSCGSTILVEELVNSNAASSLSCRRHLPWVRLEIHVDAGGPREVVGHGTGMFDGGRARPLVLGGRWNGLDGGRMARGTHGGGGGNLARAVCDVASRGVEGLDLGTAERRAQRLSEPAPGDAVQKEVHRVIHVEDLFTHVGLRRSNAFSFTSTLLVHGQVTIIFVVSVYLSVCLSVCLCRVFLSRL